MEKEQKKGYTKVILSGHVIEVMHYEKLNVLGPPDSAYDVEKGQGKDKVENYLRRQELRRDEIRRLVTNNFDKDKSKFITLTFKDTSDFDIKDVKQCNNEFKKFIKRLTYYIKKNHKNHDDLKYVAVLEFQDKNDRGAVHYHMICDLPYIKKSVLEDIWGLGFIKINAITKVDNLGAYVIKYMTKEKADERLQGLKAYNCSKGLQRPTELKSWNGIEDRKVMEHIEEILQNKKPVYSSGYTSEYAGKITYQQYNLNRD